MSPSVQAALLGTLALIVFAFGIKFVLSLVHRDPDKRERRRRLHVNQEGRLGDGMITEVSGGTIYYTYSIRGVQYETSQDVSMLADRLPDQPERLIGVTNLKYMSNNPANSIVLCEEWSGLRIRVGRATASA